MHKKIILGLVLISSLAACNSPAPQMADGITIDVALDTNHNIGGITELEREKFMTIHSHHTLPEWGDTTKLNYVLNDLDVYLGRDNETGNSDLHKIQEDPNKPGYPDIAQMEKLGLESRKRYSQRTDIHPYESRNELIIATHVHPLFPDGTANKAGWTPANSRASGQFIGHHVKNYYGDADGIHGEPTPRYFEVVNEPMWHLVTTTDISTPKKIFEHHNEMADEIRKIVPDLLIGGYCAAFPDFEVDDFQRWHDRHKLFYDMSGEHMDFLTFHLYDFPVFQGMERYRRGANMEATLDMMEQYSQMKLGKNLPWLITEFGAQVHDLHDYEEHTYRDWLFIKAANSQLMQFMEKPDRIMKVIPFFILSDYWNWEKRCTPYSITRKNDEGIWDEFTQHIKYYQFWADVKGKRLLSASNNLDIQTHAFADEDKAHVILDNLTFQPQLVNLNLSGKKLSEIEKLTIKHFHLVDSMPTIDTLVFEEIPTQFELDESATATFTYQFKSEINPTKTAFEKKYYAAEYLQPIKTSTANIFHINQVEKGASGKMVLRLGLGRDHGLSLQPEVKINGKSIPVPENWRGDSQEDRESFFGVLEIAVPYDVIRESNEVSITFNDEGGHISTVTLQGIHF